MPHLNVEIKARSEDPDHIRSLLKQADADFIGTDHQIDTYFNARNGRLKLREGSIENHLIHYQREDIQGPKKASIGLYETEPDTELKDLLSRALGVLVVVEKSREIYFIDNVKFHIDDVEGLGRFIEIEAIDREGTLGEEKLETQCRTWLDRLDVREDQLIKRSYSDLLLEQQ